MSLNCADCKKSIESKKELGFTILYDKTNTGFIGEIIKPYCKLCYNNIKQKYPKHFGLHWGYIFAMKTYSNPKQLKHKNQFFQFLNSISFKIIFFIVMVIFLNFTVKGILVKVTFSIIIFLLLGWNVYISKRNVRYLKEMTNLPNG